MSTPVAGSLATVPLFVAPGDVAVWWNDPGGTWESIPLGSGPAGPQGVPGQAGPTGATGPAGEDGNTVLYGTGAPPPATGQDGDFYIDTTPHNIYGPKAGSWATPGTSLIGPAGATGAIGPTGATGSQGIQGPIGATGATGAASTVPGPQGPAGPTGATGATGATGTAGTNANMSGMVAGQIPIAATATSVTSSIATSTFATPASVTSGDNLRVLKAGDTMTGPLVVVTTNQGHNLSVGGAAGASPIAFIRNDHATIGDLSLGVGAGPTASDTSSILIAFVDAPNTVVQGQIKRNGAGAVAYVTTSDLRAKEAIADSALGLDVLLSLRVRDFKMRGDDFTQQGLIAQELHEVYPIAVAVGGDDPAMQPWGIDYGRLTPLLVRGVQQQQERIARLEAKIAALTEGLVN